MTDSRFEVAAADAAPSAAAAAGGERSVASCAPHIAVSRLIKRTSSSSSDLCVMVCHIRGIRLRDASELLSPGTYPSVVCDFDCKGAVRVAIFDQQARLRQPTSLGS